jgi:hypothetical protein
MVKQFDNVDIPGLKIDGKGLGLISTSLVAIPNRVVRASARPKRRDLSGFRSKLGGNKGRRMVPYALCLALP